MADKQGLWISIDSDSVAIVEDVINENNRFTAVVSAGDIRPKIAELCLVSLAGESADYLGISQAGQRVATGLKRVAVSRCIHLGGINIVELKSFMSSRFASKLNSFSNNTQRIPPGLWKDMLNAIVSLRPQINNSVVSLRKLVEEYNEPHHRRAGGLEIFDRDAVASALQIWGGTKYRKRVLRSATAAAHDRAPFLSRLTDVSLREDPQIIHDSATFPGMEVARRSQVGAVEMVNERGERLTIMNCNRQPLEQTLGVDLIYYNHLYESFILIQYKRMVEEAKGKVCYRPDNDANYNDELKRMQTINELIATPATQTSRTVGAFRLSMFPFYIKLCESKAKAALDEGMVSGMYLPIDLWQRFVDSPQAKGKRGGIAIGWHNCPRHFNNGDFTALLRAGWIGSAEGQTKILGDLIETILSGRHMLIIGATAAHPTNEEPLRDTFGRFTTEDDPLASR